jgi:DNA-binding CsgD family transcriptional regulator
METSGRPQAGQPPVENNISPLLSARQIECLAWAQEGKSASEIGQIIGLSGRGVEKCFYVIYQRLGVRTRLQAVIRARELGVLGPQTRGRYIETELRGFSRK